MPRPVPPGFLGQPSRYLFCTGKGGLGKTPLLATVLALANSGKRVLLVSTDAASHLDEMRGVALHNPATPAPGAAGLWLFNIDLAAIAEAAGTAVDLHALGLNNQRPAINGVFQASTRREAVALAIQDLGQQAMTPLPPGLRNLALDRVPLRALDTVGLRARRALLGPAPPLGAPLTGLGAAPMTPAPGLAALANDLAAVGYGLIMVMGKSGVGKTTVAAALALGRVQRGKTVHLSTTDPAAQRVNTWVAAVPGLQLSRIDPQFEIQRCTDKIMAVKSPGLDAQAHALLRDDLRWPCTAEVAVFHAFARTVSQGRRAFRVLDTAPAGQSMLLMDATGAHHRQRLQAIEGLGSGRPVTPLMRLQDGAYTRINPVTRPQVTLVSRAGALQHDLHGAGGEPCAWGLNQRVLAAGAQDPLLATRLAGEHKQMVRRAAGLAKRLFTVPWLTTPPVGITELSKLVSAAAPAAAALG